MRDDLTLRSLRSNRGFTSAALIVLTLGIGATTAIFSVVDAVVLRGLPFDGQHRLVAVGERSAVTATSGAITRDPARVRFVAPQNYLDWIAQQQVFDDVGAIHLNRPAHGPGAPRFSRVERWVRFCSVWKTLLSGIPDVRDAVNGANSPGVMGADVVPQIDIVTRTGK
jgi:hypothetical protein